MRLCDIGAAIQEVMESYEIELDGKVYQARCTAIVPVCVLMAARLWLLSSSTRGLPSMLYVMVSAFGRFGPA